MDDGQSILDWGRGKHYCGIWGLPSLAVSARDATWLVVVVAVAAVAGFDRHRLQRSYASELAELSEARRTAAITAEQQAIAMTERVRGAQEEWDALVARYEDEVETVLYLEKELAQLRAAQQVTQGPQLASGAGER